MEKKIIHMKERLFDVYCHYHKHTTKVIGAIELMCVKCQKEEFDNMMNKTNEYRYKSDVAFK